MKLDDREISTILAALRAWQHFLVLRNVPQEEWDFLLDIAANGGDCKELGLKEIDALCEKINCGG